MPGVAMDVVFYKEDDGRLCGWRAAPPKRRCFQGTTMASGRDLPHDLAQFVVEVTLGLERLVWMIKPKVARRTAGIPSGSPPIRR